MAYLRAALIGLVLAFSLAIAAPLQWIALRRNWPMRLWIPTIVSRMLTSLLRLEISAAGQAVRGGPRLLAANHVSWIDILALCCVEPVCFLAKKEVGSWPVISAFAQLQETVFVDRGRRRTIPAANAALARRMRAGRCALLFPEGTTSDGRTLLKFRSSHFAAARDLLADAHDLDAVAVQPVAIRYSSPSAAWCGDATLLPHVWSILRGGPIRCDLIFGEAVSYGRETNRKEIAQLVAASVANMLAAPDAAERQSINSAQPELEALSTSPAL